MKKFMVCAAFAFAMVAFGTVNAQNAAKDSKAKTEQCCKKGGDKKCCDKAKAGDKKSCDKKAGDKKCCDKKADVKATSKKAADKK